MSQQHGTVDRTRAVESKPGSAQQQLSYLGIPLNRLGSISNATGYSCVHAVYSYEVLQAQYSANAV